MFRLSVTMLRAALTSWPVPTPLTVRRLLGGVTSDAFLLTVGGKKYVAKLTYEHQQVVATGLRAAELVAAHSDLATARPLRTTAGELSVMVECPPGKHHPLAVLHHVAGRRLAWRAPAAPHILGRVLGTVHSVLRQEDFDTGGENRLFAYLDDESHEIGEPRRVRRALKDTVAAVRRFQATTAVTYGVIYGDGLDVRIDLSSGRIGLIDWGGISWGPLLLDLAMTARQLRPSGPAAVDGFLGAYLERSPLKPTELDGRSLYERLFVASRVRFHAFRAIRGSHYGHEAAVRSRQRMEAGLRDLGY
jgi:Ser/Thr protein kinase RdoA (MazF antagonist)